VLLVLFKRFLGKRQLHKSSDSITEPLEQQILDAQQGDLKLINQIITDYQPYIAKVTSRFCKRYIDPTRDDEFSIALEAFNEAIQKFSPESGRSFLSFSETVIRRRLIDYVRKEQKFQQQVPMSSFDTEDEEDQTINPVEIRQAIKQHETDRDAEKRRHEIVEYSEELLRYGITFADLVDNSPKHVDSRRMLLGIAHTLANTEEWMMLFREKGQLPIKQLLGRVSASRKTVERNRKYIIAVALIFAGNYPYLKDYLYDEANAQERSSAHV